MEQCYHFPSPVTALPSLFLFPTIHLTSAAKKFSSQTRFYSKNRRNNLTTKEQDEEEEPKRTTKIEESNIVVEVGLEDAGWSSSEILVDGKLFPDLLGLQPDLWEEQHEAPKLARFDFVLTKCEDVVPEFGETWWGREGEEERIRVRGMVGKRESDGRAVIGGWEMAALLSL
ncbi:hypothetical protein GOBAR_AA28358 [Gossypium barbadense]|uniref:Uncharacterized protein n=1 Tax=Gossypium barbadense TaxID=3634 RepID=A0A2P5WMK5_GOSBA|nr:hypothetical protein GOBAR_AA28358 [Gossypium barbadense]